MALATAMRLLGPVDQHGVAALGEGRLDLGAAGSALDEAVDRRVIDGVGHAS